MSKLFVARNPSVAARCLDGEMMIMSGRDSTLFTLNRTATILWQAADGCTPLDELVETKICKEFRVGPAEALQDAETLARDLAAHDILQISEQPIATPNSISGGADERSDAGNGGESAHSGRAAQRPA